VVIVAEAEDGDVAAQAVADSDADVAIVDYRMPRVDGVEATRRIKARRPATDVVAFTSIGEEAIAAAFLQAGASRHFDKLAVDDLVAYIRGLAAAPS
jgi:DNA-binding NarL/FixJ family response regulator